MIAFCVLNNIITIVIASASLRINEIQNPLKMRAVQCAPNHLYSILYTTCYLDLVAGEHRLHSVTIIYTFCFTLRYVCGNYGTINQFCWRDSYLTCHFYKAAGCAIFLVSYCKVVMAMKEIKIHHKKQIRIVIVKISPSV